MPALRIALGTVVLLGLLAGWYLGLPLLRAWGNIAAMSNSPAGPPGPVAVQEFDAAERATAVAIVLTATSQPSATGTATLVPTPSPVPSTPPERPTLTQVPILTQVPTLTPIETPIVVPTETPTTVPTEPPTVAPTALPTTTPTEVPTAAPTALPTAIPTELPTAAPTEVPTLAPTTLPTAIPTEHPTTPPTEVPVPTEHPTAVPTNVPTLAVAQLRTATPLAQPADVSTEAVNVLLLGVDARPGEGFASRSDAVMVVRLDPAHSKATLLSLPRDLWVTIPGAGEGKINTAYLVGEKRQQGLAVASATVSGALGIPIDHAVVVDFAGFRSLIDTLGGVPVDVPRELYDARFPSDDYGYTVAHFTPGTEVMDGARALMYSRIRHPDSDFQRMRRQQSVLLGIARKLRERGALENLHEADRLTAALRPFVRTTMPPELVLDLLWSMRSVDAGAVQRIVVDTSIVNETRIGGSYALVADESVLHAVGAQLVGGQ